MNKAKMKVIRFDANDVIATSAKATISLSGFNDSVKNNGNISSSTGASYDATSANQESIVNMLKTASGNSSYNEDTFRFYYDSDNNATLYGLISLDGIGYSLPGMTGTFSWDSTKKNVNDTYGAFMRIQ